MSNVTVCARFRPLNSKEIESAAGRSSCIRIKDEKSFDFKDDKEGELTFSLDKIFNEGTRQEDVFSFVALPIVQDAMSGINGTVLAYGQTGSGKTHSMEGTDDPKLKGILPRVSHSIFQCIETADPNIEFIIKLSMVEIYMEKIRDLLDLTKDNLQVKEDRTRGIFVAGASEVYVQTEQEMLKLIKLGASNRAVGATHMNANSSRSHCVFMISIQQTSTEDTSVKTGKLFLVDLAGSEKLEKTCAEGKLLSEAKTINKSLSALGNVINALTSEKACHIPYRDSKLTRILQESLGGNSKTTLLCCCSSSPYNSAETLSTLRFGLRAKEIMNKPKINSERSRYELEQILSKAENECEHLRSQVIMLNARIHCLTGNGEAPSNTTECESVEIIAKLKLALARKSPSLVDIIEILKQLFEEEGLVSTSDSSETDSRLMINEDVSKTLSLVEKTMEDLTDRFDKLSSENAMLEAELVFYKDLLKNNTSGDRSRISAARKAQIIRPLRGGMPELVKDPGIINRAEPPREGGGFQAALSWIWKQMKPS